MRSSYIGIMSGFQSLEVGSIPALRSNYGLIPIVVFAFSELYFNSIDRIFTVNIIPGTPPASRHCLYAGSVSAEIDTQRLK